MPTLPLNQYAGEPRARGNCGCDAPKVGSTLPTDLVPTSNACQPGPGNVPVEESEFQCSLGVRLQPAIDRSRRVAHTLGMRPYRVFLVWQERRNQRKFVEVARCELIPVRVQAMDSLELELTQAGLTHARMIKLREISPALVDEDILRGHLDGKPWTGNDREFFYEVVMFRRCSTDPPRIRRRFILGNVPHFEATAFEFKVGLMDQLIDRTREGVDQTLPPFPDRASPSGRIRLIT